MAAVERNDFITDSALKAPLEMADNIERMNAELKKVIDTTSKVLSSIGNMTQSSSEQKKSTDELTKAQERLEKTNLEISRQVTKLNVQTQERNKQLRQEAKESLGLVGAYQKLTKQLADARNKYKDLAASGKATTQQLKEQQRVVEQLNRRVLTIDKAVGQFQRNVGNYPGTFLAAGNALRSFLGAFGLISGITLFASALRSAINVNIEFEKSISNLSAITGATGKDLEFYKEQAADIGATTTLSAVQAVEAFKLIGGARPELLKVKEDLVAVTREAIVLAEASGLDLPAAASALTGALNQLQLPSEEASNIINTLAAGAKEGAAEIPAINDALQKFGAVAKTANLSISESVALVETLADRQIQGAEAGTALRNVLLRLTAVNTLPQDAISSLRKYNVDLKKVSDTTLPLRDRLQEFGKIAGDINAIVEVFGKENAVAGQIILNNIDRYDELNQAITGTNEAYRQQSVNVDNLAGDLAGLKSVTEGLIIDIGSSTQGFLRRMVQAFTFFIGVLREIPGFIKENRDLLIQLGIAIIGLRLPLIISTALTLKDIAVKKLYAIATRAATLATTQFFTVLTANPFGLILISLAAIAAAISIYDRNSRRANTIAKQTLAINRDLDAAFEEVRIARDELNLSIDEFLKLSPKEQQAHLEKIQNLKKETLATLEFIEARKTKLKGDAAELTLSQKLQSELLFYVGATNKAVKATHEFGAANQNAIDDEFSSRISQLKDEINSLGTLIEDKNKALDDQREDEEEKAKNSTFELRKFRLEQAIKSQKEISENEAKFIDVRLAASQEAERLGVELAKIERDKALLDAQKDKAKQILLEEQFQAQKTELEKAGVEERRNINNQVLNLDRELAQQAIKANIKANEEIINSEKATFQERNAALTEAFAGKQALLDLQYEQEKQDASSNYAEILRIQREYNAASEALTKELSDSLSGNIVEEFSRITEGIETSNANQLRVLNDQFAKGEISIQEFQARRLELQNNSQKNLLNSQLDFFENQLQDLRAQGIDTAAVEALIWQLRNEAAQQGADERLEIEQRMQQALQDLRQTAIQTAIDINANFAEAEQIRLEEQLQRLQEQKDAELRAVGDNARAKEQIEATFAQKEKQIQEKQRRERQKQAVLDKAIAAFEIAINTASAVVEALPNIPLSIAVGAIGALQLATVLTKPIPKFWMGSDYTPDTFIAGDRGSEIVGHKKGLFVAEKPTLFTGMEGATVVPHPRTMDILGTLEDANVSRSILSTLSLRKLSSETRNDAELLQEVRQLNKNFRKKGTSGSVDVVLVGSVLYEAKDADKTFKKFIRSLSMGKWD